VEIVNAATGGAGAMGAGVLRAEAAATRFGLSRHPPPDDLAPFVDFCWVVRWDLRGQPPYEQAILPHPNVNLVFEAAGAAVYGVDRTIFTRRLSGKDKALGVRFRPGGFRPFCSAPISTLNDLVVLATQIFGPAADQAREAVMAAASDDAMIAGAVDLLRGASPRPDPVAEQVAGLVGRITSDPALRRVADLADIAGMSERRLQRLFADYVGVPPKWVMRRARLHEAALRADAGAVVDWAALAADLGYADQAHLTRDFTATLGVPPSRYACRAGLAADRGQGDSNSCGV
jgi:AraC-like DNA-binding protein